MTDNELLEQIVSENDSEAFRALIDRHGPMVLSVCRSILGAQHDAEDAFQLTFLALSRRASTIREKGSVGPWLHRVALRIAHRARRRKSKGRSIESMRPEFEPECPFQPRDLSFVPMLREEVSRLPERYRQPLVLCYLDGKTNEEAAAQLHCPIGTIKGRLSRARQTLRDRLSRRGLHVYLESLERN